MNTGEALLLAALTLGTLGLTFWSVVEVHGLWVAMTLRRDYGRARELDLAELMETPAEGLPPLCRVSGILGPGEEGILLAPASGRECVAFHTTISYRHESGGERGTRTEILWARQTTDPIRLTDGPATVWLSSELYQAPPEVLWAGHGVWQPLPDEVSRARLERDSRGARRSVGPVEPAEHLASLMRQRAIGPGRLLDSRPNTTYVVSEKTIAPGTEVHVLAQPRLGPRGVMLVAPRRRRSFVLALSGVQARRILAGVSVLRRGLTIAAVIACAVLAAGATVTLFRAFT